MRQSIRTIIPGAKYSRYDREKKPGGGMTKSRHIWKMPKDIGFVTQFVSAGARNMWTAIMSPARELTSTDPKELRKIIQEDARQPTPAERRNLLKRVPVFRGVDIDTARMMRGAQRRAAVLKARARAKGASGMLKDLLAGTS